jgi:hypothetical protein
MAKITKQEIIERFVESIESEEIQLDNLDWAKLVITRDLKVVVQNEHGTQFDIDELSNMEKFILYDNI